MAAQKQIHSLVVDTGPLIKNTISISTIIQSAEHIYTTSAVLSEIKDPATRQRVETTLIPFLNIRNPSPASYEHVAQFSKKTGDFPVLSRQDLGILALAYEIDQEKKKELEVAKDTEKQVQPEANEREGAVYEIGETDASTKAAARDRNDEVEALSRYVPETASESRELKAEEQVPAEGAAQEKTAQEQSRETQDVLVDVRPLEGQISDIHLSHSENTEIQDFSPETQEAQASSSGDDSDGEWITPGNVKKHQAKDSGVSLTEKEPTQLSCATMTTDYAMQNVLLQMKLSLISPSMQRIKNLRTYILRCHACFLTTKEMEKQFCPRCGGATLNRVACSTNAKGEYKIHMSKNFQYNKRGDRYSVPKPIHGTANGKYTGKGGGKGGWGRDLVLAEDQKEYVRGMAEEKRARTRDLMDEDYLPNILTGDRGRAGGRPKVGAGKNVNSRKRY